MWQLEGSALPSYNNHSPFHSEFISSVKFSMIYKICEVQLTVNQPLCHFLISVIYGKESTTKGIY